MFIVEFTVAGEPVAQGRPRFARCGSRVITYDPPKSREYKKRVAERAQIAMKEKGWEAMQCPVIIFIDAYFQIPKSWAKKRQEQAQEKRIYPCKKPDLDNVVKIVKDALTGVVYYDDCQVVGEVAYKYYGGIPRVEVSVKEM